MADLPDYYTQVIALEAEAYKFRGGADVSKSETPTSRDVYFATDTKILYVCVHDGTWTGFDASILVQGILTLYENMDANSKKITNLAAPTLANDATRKAYVDTLHALCLLLTGGTMSGNIAMGNNKVTGLAAPTLANDAARRTYVDTLHALCLLLTGGTMQGGIIMNNKVLSGLRVPTGNDEATRKDYVDGLFTTHIAISDAHHARDHKDRHDPNDGSDKLDTAIAVKVGDANAIGTSHSLARADHVHEKHHAKYLNAEAVSAVEAAGLNLASGKNIRIIQALTTDYTWSGITAILTASAGITQDRVCYVHTDSKLKHALATGAATMPAMALATHNVIGDAEGEFLLQGFLRDDTWNWTAGGLLYVSKDTAGLMTQTRPAASGEQVQVVGIAITADIIYFNPSYELVEIS